MLQGSRHGRAAMLGLQCAHTYTHQMQPLGHVWVPVEVYTGVYECVCGYTLWTTHTMHAHAPDQQPPTRRHPYLRQWAAHAIQPGSVANTLR